MTRLTSIRRVLEKEYVYKVDDKISGGHIRLCTFIKVGVLNDTLEVSIGKQRLEF